MLNRGLRFAVCMISLMVLTLTVLAACTAPQAGETPAPHTNRVLPGEGQKDIYDLSYLKDKNPAEVDNSNLPITPVDRLSLTGKAPKSVDIDAYRLTVSGRVKSTLDITYKELQSFPEVTKVVLLICHGSHVDNARWTGVPVSLLLDKAGLLPDAHEVSFIALDRYSRTLSLEIVKATGTFVAYKVNGEAIPLKHGYPVRLVVKDQFGENWVKWLRQIDVQ